MLKKLSFPLLGATLLFTLLFSCKKKDDTLEKIDYSYFPLDSGRYFIYHVDTICIDDFTGTTSSGSYELKDVVSGSYKDNSNRLTYQVSRYRRSGDTVPWGFQQVYSANLTTTTAEIVIDNQRYIKMSFPVAKGVSWNSNSFNTQQPKQLRYTSTGDNPTVQGKLYNNAATVFYLDSNLIHKTIYSEQYAPGVGKIYGEYVNDSISSSTFYPGQPPTGGNEVRMYLKSTGK